MSCTCELNTGIPDIILKYPHILSLTEPHLPIKPTVEYRTGRSMHIIVVLPLSVFLCQHPGLGTQERNRLLPSVLLYTVN